jgi:hypothetical protein
MYVLECIKAPEPIIARVNERNNVTGSSLEIWDTVPPDVQQLFLSKFAVDFDVQQYPRHLPRRPLPEYP